MTDDGTLSVMPTNNNNLVWLFPTKPEGNTVDSHLKIDDRTESFELSFKMVALLSASQVRMRVTQYSQT